MGSPRWSIAWFRAQGAGVLVQMLRHALVHQRTEVLDIEPREDPSEHRPCADVAEEKTGDRERNEDRAGHHPPIGWATERLTDLGHQLAEEWRYAGQLDQTDADEDLRQPVGDLLEVGVDQRAAR